MAGEEEPGNGERVEEGAAGNGSFAAFVSLVAVVSVAILLLRGVLEGPIDPILATWLGLSLGWKLTTPKASSGKDKSAKERKCFGCGKPNVESRCKKCKTAWYCSVDCQTRSWENHKTVCIEYIAKVKERDELIARVRDFADSLNIKQPKAERDEHSINGTNEDDSD